MGDQDTESDLAVRLERVRRRTAHGFGARADELENAAKAAREGDDSARGQLRLLAHRLRGTAGTVGYSDITELAGRLEDAALGGASLETVIAQANGLAAALRAAKDRSARPRSSVSSEREAAPAPRRPLNCRALLVDDDPALLRLVDITLRAAGCETRAFTSGREALGALAEEPANLVIVDAMMPDTNGLEFYYAVRERCGPSVPVVILSAASPSELGWTLPTDGRLRWMHKPFRPGALVDDLRPLVEGT